MVAALSGCTAGATGAVGAPGLPAGGLPGLAQIAYDWTAAFTARHSGGKVTLPPFDASKLQTTSLPFKFENGRITMGAGIQNVMLRLAQRGQAQLFANGNWFAIPLPVKAGYVLRATDATPAQSFVMVSTSQKRGLQQTAGPLSFILMAIENGAGSQEVAGSEAAGSADPASRILLATAAGPASQWKVVGGDGPDDCNGGAGNDRIEGGGGDENGDEV